MDDTGMLRLFLTFVNDFCRGLLELYKEKNLSTCWLLSSGWDYFYCLYMGMLQELLRENWILRFYPTWTKTLISQKAESDTKLTVCLPALLILLRN